MGSCPICGAATSTDARYCPHCGAALPARETMPAVPWAGPAPARLSPDGTLAQAPVGQPLSSRQVWVGVGLVLVFLVGLALYAGYRRTPGETATTPGALPTLGAKGEAVTVGDTVLGVAFTDTTDTLNGKPASRGEYYAVGIVVGNHSDAPVELSADALPLALGGSEARYAPTFTAWGEPEELNRGEYRPTHRLAPGATIAGLLVYDVARTHSEERLLVRDLMVPDSEFAGVIDLTREAE